MALVIMIKMMKASFDGYDISLLMTVVMMRMMITVMTIQCAVMFG